MEVSQRKKQLYGILSFLDDCETDILKALKNDLCKSKFEALAIELGPIKTEINYALKNIDSWTAPQNMSTPLLQQPGKSWIKYEPLGNILIIAPWNYPFQLTLSPLVGALSAGNCVTLKPSELAKHSAQLLAQKLPNYIPVEIFLGGAEVTQKLLEKKWEHIVFTGSSRIGKIIYEKASAHLTPVTLELGGKCPVIVDANSNLNLAARRIAWGKFINAGQTCVAPDYLLAQEDIAAELTQKLRENVAQFFGRDPEKSPDYARIINQEHLNRLLKLAPFAKYNIEKNYLEPTFLENITDEHPSMQEEIFGPILPILTFKKIEDALTFINSKPKALALYFFSNCEQLQKQVAEQANSSAVSINDVVSYLGIPELPFGGVGESGFGYYHGRWGFERFSYIKSVYKHSRLIDIPLRYPPYNETNLKIASWFQK